MAMVAMNKNILILTITAALLFILPVIAFSPGSASAATEQTTYARVYILNSAPSSIVVYESPDPATPGVSVLNINSTVTDPNGVPGDIASVTFDLILPNGTVWATLTSTYNAGTGAYENTTYALPSNAPPGNWTVNATATDNNAGTIWNTTTFTVVGVASMYLSQYPIDFGNTTVPVTDRRADNSTAGNGYSGGTIKGFPLKSHNNGSVALNFSVRGDNLVGQTNNSYVLGVGNLTYNGTASLPGTALSGSYTNFASNIGASSSTDLYFWIDIPSGFIEQEYKGNVTVKATVA